LESLVPPSERFKVFFIVHLISASVWIREESKKAAECLREALRDYNLKFGTILNDPDLAPFRASPEFKELQEEVCDFELHCTTACWRGCNLRIIVADWAI
jgi:hypothetical protein